MSTSSDETTTATTEEDPSMADAGDTEMIKAIPLESAPANPSSNGAMDGLLAIICEEVDFAEAGVDPMMSLIIIGRAHEELDIGISSSFL